MLTPKCSPFNSASNGILFLKFPLLDNDKIDEILKVS